MEVENLNGFKIGVLEEGFGLSVSQEEVDMKIKDAAQKLKCIGAQVTDVSIPLHKNSEYLCNSLCFPYISYRVLSREVKS